MIPDEDLERFLKPLLARWNGLPAEALRGLRATPLAEDPTVAVTYVGEETWPFGYRYVELQFSKADAFQFSLRIEGAPGDLSTDAHLPVVRLRGDAEACRTWLRQVVR